MSTGNVTEHLYQCRQSTRLGRRENLFTANDVWDAGDNSGPRGQVVARFPRAR